MNQPTPTTIIAKARFVRQSPKKLGLLAGAIRKLKPAQAVEYLKVIRKRAARPLLLVMTQGIANAKNNFQISPGDLVIESLAIEKGPMGPKRMDKAHGARFNRGVRRGKTAHIVLRLAVRNKPQEAHGTKS